MEGRIDQDHPLMAFVICADRPYTVQVVPQAASRPVGSAARWLTDVTEKQVSYTA